VVLAATSPAGHDGDVPTRRIVLVAADGLQSLDLTGPLEVLHAAGRVVPGAYRIQVAGTAGTAPVRSTSGLALLPDVALADVRGHVDTLIVAGGEGARAAAEDLAVVAAVRRAAGRSRRVASVCTGAFLLAAAGLLDGRRATTHWASCRSLAERHPRVEVDPDPIFVRDGDVWTSAGVTAGLDLALALVEEDLGRRVALEVARWLVVFLQRPGGQSQFSAPLVAQAAQRRPLRDLQAWVAEHLGEDLTVARLAERVAMSERTFSRAFRRETGITPAAWVEGLRVERARMALEDSDAGVDVVARACGFRSVETLRRAFHRRLGVGPAAYRSRFRPAA
jgi:transcriptional regulator GlxA family with amidase domain